MFLAVN